MSIDKLDLEQRVGIFQVPDFVEEDMSVKNWRREKRPLFEEIPLVVEEEIYSKAGVVSKLRLNFRSCEKFEKKYGLLRLKKDFNSGGKKISPYGTLSIAQFTSFLFNEPIENILFSENYFKKKSFLEKNAQERVRILFNSYFGCSWFNSFYKKQKRLAELVDPPKVKIWQRISVKNLEDWFISTNDKGGFVGKLRKKGFLIPRFEKEFRSVGNSKNIVEPFGLAQLLALVYDLDIADLLVINDLYPKEISRTFAKNKLLPYLEEKKILFYKRYSIKESSVLTGLNWYTLYDAAKRGAIPNVKFKKDGKTKILGIDLVIYALKNTSKLNFDYSELLDLFGVEFLDCAALGIKRSSNGKYSRHHYVFPVYDYITSLARETVMSKAKIQEKIVPVYWNGSTFKINHKTQKNYCRRYGLKEFNADCLQHITEQLSTVPEVYDGKIATDQLVFTFKGEEIKNIDINLDIKVKNKTNVNDLIQYFKNSQPID